MRNTDIIRYYKEEANRNAKETMTWVYEKYRSEISEGKEIMDYHTIRAIVVYSKECDKNTTLKGTEKQIHHIKEQLCCMINDKFKDEKYAAEKTELDSLIAELDSEPKGFKIVTLYEFILENWDELKDYERTYRMLSSIAGVKRTFFF